MENLQLNGFIAGGMALASVLRVTCVVGKSMLMPVQALEAIGGFARVRNLLAEDQVDRRAGAEGGLLDPPEPPCHRQRQPPPRVQLVPQPPLAVVQDPPPDGPARLPGRADGQPGDRRPGLGVLGRLGHRLGRPGSAWSAWAWCATPSRPAGWRGAFPELRKSALQPVKDLLLLAALVRRDGQLRACSGAGIGSTSAGSPACARPASPATSAAASAGSAGCGLRTATEAGGT